MTRRAAVAAPARPAPPRGPRMGNVVGGTAGLAGSQQIKNYGPSVVDSDGKVATLRLYDVIDSYGGWWGMSAGEFANVLDGLPRGIEEIRLHINSPGGDVFEGIAILNALRGHPARITTIVDGLAASIASVIALAGDDMRMSPNSEFMIHEAWGGAIGTAADMRKLADVLDHISDNIAGAYATRAGDGSPESVAHWRALMAEETWFSAEETVQAGLADGLSEPRSASGGDPIPADVLAASFDLSAFKYHGRAKAPVPGGAAARKTPSPALARAQAALLRGRHMKGQL